MAAALAAFASPEVHRLVHQMLVATDSANHAVVDSGIMSYPVLWTLSVHDWLWSSGEGAVSSLTLPTTSPRSSTMTSSPS
jgi:hypothetical protein